ncbi:MAG: hypothetical protein IT558_04990 [Alphaproteobacteria bacterium]|nr:hypothetical protein [Alphaproteobacteria bacterium]
MSRFEHHKVRAAFHKKESRKSAGLMAIFTAAAALSAPASLYFAYDGFQQHDHSEWGQQEKYVRDREGRIERQIWYGTKDLGLNEKGAAEIILSLALGLFAAGSAWGASANKRNLDDHRAGQAFHESFIYHENDDQPRP